MQTLAQKRAYQRLVMRRWRERRKNDPEWRERERAWRRKSYAKLSSDPKWRARKNAKQKIRNAIRRKDPKYRAQQSKYLKQKALREWLAISGWTYEQNEAAKKQGCKICGETKKRLMRDHDHVTGKGRGLLCHKCNCSLGWFENKASTILEYVGRV